MSKRTLPSAALLILVLLFASSSLLAQTLSVGSFDGKPKFKEDDELSYYVWREGSRWHVRWTTWGGMRLFTGNVMSEGGEVKDLKRVDVETERRVIRPGRPGGVWRGPRGRLHAAPGRAPVVVSREQDRIEREDDHRIRFVARTNDVDGFDFTVDDQVKLLRFVLEIDGRVALAEVEAGKGNQEIPRVPFVVQIK
jgi:hypothetical protein